MDGTKIIYSYFASVNGLVSHPMPVPDDRTRRRFLTLVGSAGATAVAGCSGNEPSEEATETDTPEETQGGIDQDATATDTETEPDEGGDEEYTGGTLRLASSGRIQTLDPPGAKAAGSGYNQYQEPPMKFENGDLPATGRLVTDYEISNGGRTYTLSLKEGVQFHPADELDEAQQEMTASDVVYSWERIAQSDNSRNKNDIIGGAFSIAHEGNTDDDPSNYEPWSMELEAVDDYTVEFTLETPFHGTISSISAGTFGVIPEGAVGDITRYDGIWDYEEFFGTAGDGPAFVGTGPFEVDRWSKGDELVLSRFEDYHGEGPYIDGITYTALSGGSAEYQRAINGNLDMFQVPTAQFNRNLVEITDDKGQYQVGRYGPMENGETVNYGVGTTLRTEYFYFNTQRVERPVRRAIAHLVDQQEIADSIYKGINEPAFTVTPNVVFPSGEDEGPVATQERFVQDGYRAVDVPEGVGTNGYPYGVGSFSIERAREIMENAGYGEDDPYEMTMTVYSEANFTDANAWQEVATRIRDKAVSAHIDISIERANLGTIISQAVEGSMDMFSLGDGMEWPEADNFLRYAHPPEDPAGQFTRWSYEDKSEWTPFMNRADEAWSQYQDHRAGGPENQRQRNQAYFALEQCNWAAVHTLPTVYSIRQRWWTDDVDVRMVGPMGRQTFNTVTISRE
jgi:peptide/nickel transport system substrate-binding protein